MCGSGPGRTRPHNCRCLRHHGRKQPQLGRTAAVESNSSIRFKRLFQTCLKQGSSRQMQGVVVAALSRQLELRARCAASASCSSAEAASSVLSTSSESWIARVGRANSSTRHDPPLLRTHSVLLLTGCALLDRRKQPAFFLAMVGPCLRNTKLRFSLRPRLLRLLTPRLSPVKNALEDTKNGTRDTFYRCNCFSKFHLPGYAPADASTCRAGLSFNAHSARTLFCA